MTSHSKACLWHIAAPNWNTFAVLLVVPIKALKPMIPSVSLKVLKQTRGGVLNVLLSRWIPNPSTGTSHTRYSTTFRHCIAATQAVAICFLRKKSCILLQSSAKYSSTGLIHIHSRLGTITWFVNSSLKPYEKLPSVQSITSLAIGQLIIPESKK